MCATSILIRAAAWLGIAAITGWCWTTAAPRPRGALASSGVVLEERVYRADGESRATLDVYLPPVTATPMAPGPRRPAVLAIHGGSWCGGSKSLFRSDPRTSTIVRLAAAGLVIIAVDYRLARPGSPGWPGALDDLRAAVRWTRRHAQELGIDPDRIIALGQSSGAHLAALLGTLPDPAEKDGASSRVRAVINFYGPSDLDRLAEDRHLAHEPARIFLGDAPATTASPINHVTPDDAPMLLLHGTDDLWVPLAQSERLAAALRKAGVKHRLIVVNGARHGFEALVKSPEDWDLLPEIFDFLGSVWNVGSR